MTKRDIVRAWKDEEYRENLPEAAREDLPENPVGMVELPDAELAAAAGGRIWTFRDPDRDECGFFKHCLRFTFKGKIC